MCGAAYGKISKLEFKLAEIPATNPEELKLKERYAAEEYPTGWPGGWRSSRRLDLPRSARPESAKAAANSALTPQPDSRDNLPSDNQGRTRTKQMLLILIIFSIMFYFWPAIIAKGRCHNNAAAIFFTNFLLGWTALGWIGAFTWAMTADVKDPTRGMSRRSENFKPSRDGLEKFAVLVTTLTILIGAMFILLVLGARDYP